MGAGKTTGILEKSFKCAAALAANVMVKFGADDDHVVVATAVGDLIIGVTTHATTDAEQAVRVQMLGIADVKTAGVITRGTFVTTNNAGLGVAAAPGGSPPANNSVIGRALKTSASGDIIPVLLGIGQVQGVA